MKISAVEAIDHIVNSLENVDADTWYDRDNSITWEVGFAENGIQFTFYENDGTETTQTFALVEMA